MTSCYRRLKHKKRQKYDQWVWEVEHASFVPLVMSCTGGASPSATVFLRRLNVLSSEKNPINYSTVIELLRFYLSLALLRPSIVCFHSSRSSACHPKWLELGIADRGPDQMMLTVLTVFTSIRHYHYFYCYNCVCCCIGFFILVYSLPMYVL